MGLAIRNLVKCELNPVIRFFNAKSERLINIHTQLYEIYSHSYRDIEKSKNSVENFCKFAMECTIKIELCKNKNKFK